MGENPECEALYGPSYSAAQSPNDHICACTSTKLQRTFDDFGGSKHHGPGPLPKIPSQGSYVSSQES